MTDASARLQAYQEIQKKIMADAPWAPFRHQEFVTIVNKRVGGFKIDAQWLFNLRGIWINPAP